MTLHRKPKKDYKDLVPQYVPYKPTYIGNILFNGHLVKANANYGCFLTINSSNPVAANLPDNMRVSGEDFYGCFKFYQNSVFLHMQIF